MEESRTITHGIANLFAVEQNIYRGGDPTPEGWAWLKGEGVKVVVKLNTQCEGTDAVAEKLGMIVHRFPIPWWRQTILRPSMTTLRNALAVIIQRKAPVFVHCEFGRERTGLLIACFRLWQGWSKDEAYTEMIAHGFRIAAAQGLFGRWNSIDQNAFSDLTTD